MKVNDVSFLSINDVLNVSKANEIVIKTVDKTVKIIAGAGTYYVSKISTEAEIIEEGSISIRKDLIKLLGKSGLVSIDGNNISYGNRSISVVDNSLSAETYLEFDNFKPLVTLNRNVFDELVTNVYAVSQDDARPILKGVHFKLKGNVIETCALDGYRMATRKVEDENYSFDNYEFTVPEYLIKAVEKMKCGNITIEINNELIKLGDKDFYVVADLLKGNFVNYEQLIPSDSKTGVNINSSQLLDILKDYKSRLVTLKFGEDSDSINLHTTITKQCKRIVASNGKKLTEYYESPVADIKDKISCKWHGEPLEVSFNSKYFIDSLKDKTGSINIKFNSPISPIVIEQDNKFDLVLPVRIIK